MMGRGGAAAEQVAKAMWEGGKLKIVTTTANGDQTRYVSLEGGKLVLDTTAMGRDGAPATTKTTYSKARRIRTRRYTTGRGGPSAAPVVFLTREAQLASAQLGRRQRRQQLPPPSSLSPDRPTRAPVPPAAPARTAAPESADAARSARASSMTAVAVEDRDRDRASAAPSGTAARGHAAAPSARRLCEQLGWRASSPRPRRRSETAAGCRARRLARFRLIDERRTWRRRMRCERFDRPRHVRPAIAQVRAQGDGDERRATRSTGRAGRRCPCRATRARSTDGREGHPGRRPSGRRTASARASRPARRCIMLRWRALPTSASRGRHRATNASASRASSATSGATALLLAEGGQRRLRRRVGGGAAEFARSRPRARTGARPRATRPADRCC